MKQPESQRLLCLPLSKRVDQEDGLPVRRSPPSNQEEAAAPHVNPQEHVTPDHLSAPLNSAASTTGTGWETTGSTRTPPRPPHVRLQDNVSQSSIRRLINEEATVMSRQRGRSNVRTEFGPLGAGDRRIFSCREKFEKTQIETTSAAPSECEDDAADTCPGRRP